MAGIQQLQNPPIQEAVLAVRTNLVAESSVPIGSLIPKSIAESFPGERQSFAMRARLAPLDEPPATHTEHSIFAELRDSPSRDRTVSIRRDGVSLSAVNGQYTNWEDFQDEFVAVWRAYKAKNEPHKITRVSTRFINRISLPYDDRRLTIEDWLSCVPPIPDELPDALHRFSSQLEIAGGNKYKILLNLVSVGSSEDGRSLVVFLDIDVSREMNVDAATDEFLKYFVTLRQLKNQAFFGSLTESSVELFL